MNILELGAIGEMIGGVAVIGSLIFVAASCAAVDFRLRAMDLQSPFRLAAIR